MKFGLRLCALLLCSASLCTVSLTSSPIHPLQRPQQPPRLRPQHLHTLHKQHITFKLARALHIENKMILHPAQLHFPLKLIVPQTLPRHRVAIHIRHHGLGVPLAPLVRGVLRVRGVGFGSGNARDVDDALGEAGGELVRVLAEDRGEDGDGGQQAVCRGRDGRELRVVGADALVRVEHEVEFLARAELGDEDIWVDGADRVVFWEFRGLLPLGLVDEVARVDGGVDVFDLRVGGVAWGGGVAGAGDFQVEDDGVVVGAVGRADVVLLVAWVPPFHPAETGGRAGERDEAEAVGEDLVDHDRGVVLDVDFFDGEGGDLGEEDASEGVGDAGVDADEGEGRFQGVIFVEDDFEAFGELV